MGSSSKTVLSVTSDVVVSSASSDTQDIVSEIPAAEPLPEAVDEVKQEAEPTSGDQTETVEVSTAPAAPKEEPVIADEPETPVAEPVSSEPSVQIPTKETKPDTLENVENTEKNTKQGLVEKEESNSDQKNKTEVIKEPPVVVEKEEPVETAVEAVPEVKEPAPTPVVAQPVEVKAPVEPEKQDKKEDVVVNGHSEAI